MSSQPSIRTIPFYVSLPYDIDFDIISDSSLSSSLEKNININSKKLDQQQNDNSKAFGVVGTITILKSSVMVWMGWSVVTTTAAINPVDSIEDKEMISNVGNISEIRRREATAQLPIMGPLAIAMPRTNYNNQQQQQASSQLLGGEDEEDQMMGHQMACRLSKKLNCPVLVSCSLSISRNVLSQVAVGGSLATNELIAQRASAFAEKKICDIVLREGQVAINHS